MSSSLKSALPATKTGEDWVWGSGLVNAAAVGQRTSGCHTQHKGGRCRRCLSSSAEVRCSRPGCSRPAPGPCPGPAPWGGPARPRSHRQAAPESRGRDQQPPLRPGPSRSAPPAGTHHPTAPGCKGETCSKNGEKNSPKRPWGSPSSPYCQCHHSCRSKQSPGGQMLTANLYKSELDLQD